MRKIIAFVIIFTLGAGLATAGPIKFPQAALSLTFAGLSAADTALTIVGTQKPGLVEANRLLRPLLERRQYAAVWTIQATGAALVLLECHALIHAKSRTSRTVGYILLVAVNVGRAYLVINNARLNARH
jgi:hypothetical protein